MAESPEFQAMKKIRDGLVGYPCVLLPEQVPTMKWSFTITTAPFSRRLIKFRITVERVE